MAAFQLNLPIAKYLFAGLAAVLDDTHVVEREHWQVEWINNGNVGGGKGIRLRALYLRVFAGCFYGGLHWLSLGNTPEGP